MEAHVAVTNNNHIVKGKRTKRQRPSSPLAFDITTSSSWSGAAASGSQSPTTTSAKFGDTTEEEEDMANCLILLAQGQSFDQNSKQIDDGALIMEKFNTRRFNQGATATTNKAGYYLYQCKTCSRCFSSFQALGGHRASHKKLKGMAEEKKTLLLLEDDSPSLNLQIGSRPSYTTNNNKFKIHECAVCGSEFTSGQALGGHMRRHRSSGTTTNMNIASAMDTILVATQDMNKEKNVLSLDLNLPAPEEERESKFSFASKQHQQQPLVLSASSLVDCHY